MEKVKNLDVLCFEGLEEYPATVSLNITPALQKQVMKMQYIIVENDLDSCTVPWDDVVWLDDAGNTIEYPISDVVLIVEANWVGVIGYAEPKEENIGRLTTDNISIDSVL